MRFRDDVSTVAARRGGEEKEREITEGEGGGGGHGAVRGYDKRLLMTKLPLIKEGFQAFSTEGGDEFGAVRAVAPGGQPEIVVYVENSGDFTIPLTAVHAVHDGKVIVDLTKVDSTVRAAISRAHNREVPGV